MNLKNIHIRPKIPGNEENFTSLCKRLQKMVEENGHLALEKIQEFRKEVAPPAESISTVQLRYLAAANVMLDLIAQGWNVKVKKNFIYLDQPNFDNLEMSEIKDRIRNSHLLQRNAQLRTPAVVEFIKKMERRTLTEKGWHSIFSLMRDGSDLAEALQNINQIQDDNKKIAMLSTIISPYIEFVTSEARCEHTGLKLNDIWRYFRHTWINEYKTLPGRSIQILIRDASAQNHPVIGIAALGSSVVQQIDRDKWIGWYGETFVEKLIERPTSKIVHWLHRAVDELISEIYTDDIKADGLFNSSDIKYPTNAVIDRLQEEATKAKKRHRDFPQVAQHRTTKGVNLRHVDWQKQTMTYLYRSKRIDRLASLLSIRKTFQESGFTEPRVQLLKNAFKSFSFRNAISSLVRLKKAKHVGINMLDIIVCGAIAPYNFLLGGKLVSLLMFSPEIIDEYRRRYKSQISVIASSMKGEPVRRDPKLVLLGTTSLYGISSSQYNRLRLPCGDVGGSIGITARYHKIGLSRGYGSYHFSSSTINLLRFAIARGRESRKVNYIFGEGVNPLMRHIREALLDLGFPTDELLQHGSQRVVYGIPLAHNFKEILLDLESSPKYYVPQSLPKERSATIANYWIRRWLLARICRQDVIEEVKKNTLAYPIKHGARVSLPLEDDKQMSFDLEI